jgi:hypothetical protein
MLELLFSSGVLNPDDGENNGDNAMFFKKPLQDYTCASCESSLDKKVSKIPVYQNWKKLP